MIEPIDMWSVKLLKAAVQYAFVGASMIALGASAAKGASVRSGACPWKHLSEQTQRVTLQTGLLGGPASLMSRIPKGELASAERACGVNDKNQAVYRRAEAGYMLQIISEEWLTKYAEIPPSELDAAWKRAGDNIRNTAKKWAIYLTLEPDELNDLYSRFFRVLEAGKQLNPKNIRPQVLTYIQGRALQDAYNPEIG